MSNPIKESTLERWIQNQMKVWESEKKIIEKEEKPRPFITISRQYGCFANDIAEEKAKALNTTTTNNKWSVYDKNLINKIEQQYNISEKIVETIDTRRREEMSELWRTMLADLPPQAAVFQKFLLNVVLTAPVIFHKCSNDFFYALPVIIGNDCDYSGQGGKPQAFHACGLPFKWR